MNNMQRRKVVVTGLGCVSPLGIGVDSTWDGLVNGNSGIGPITLFDASDYATRFAGECSDYKVEDYFPKIESKKLDRFSQFSLVSAEEALKDSGLLDAKYDPERVGVIMGSGIGGIAEIESQHTVLSKRGPGRLSPFFIPKMMVNAMSGQVSIKHGFEGPNFATASACASASHAIGMALRTIQYGEADVMVTGGAETSVTPLGIGGFCSMKAMSTRNEDPQAASRPFDKDRDGFVMGEGAAMLVLEEEEHARKRGANILAEMAGYGATADAHHITAPREDGKGPSRAMQIAMQDAGMKPEDVHYINAHGTSTEYNDVVETRAIKSVLGDQASKVAISASKSMLGHLLGASGCMGAVAVVLSIHRGVVHPTRNLENPDERCDLDYVPGAAREMRVGGGLGNSLGFGGHNACLAFRAVGG